MHLLPCVPCVSWYLLIIKQKWFLKTSSWELLGFFATVAAVLLRFLIWLCVSNFKSGCGFIVPFQTGSEILQIYGPSKAFEGGCAKLLSVERYWKIPVTKHLQHTMQCIQVLENNLQPFWPDHKVELPNQFLAIYLQCTVTIFIRKMCRGRGLEVVHAQS